MEHMFAIVTISGKQYKVSVGDVLTVDKIDGNVDAIVTFDHVLLVNEKEKTTVGTPVISGVKIKAKIIAQEKGEKIEVLRYKSKVRYRRHNGFRPMLTRIEITAIK